jgi:hypothetical protein
VVDERNMCMEYWWNDTDRKTTLLAEKPFSVAACSP